MSSVDGENVLTALRDARTREELFEALQAAISLMKSPNFSTFMKYRVLSQLVNMLEPPTLGLLTMNEFQKLLKNLFRKAPIDSAFMVLVNALRSCHCSQTLRTQHIIILLDELEKTNLASLLCESLTKDPDDAEWNAKEGELCNLLGQATSLLHNALGNCDQSNPVKSYDARLETYLCDHWINMRKGIMAAVVEAFNRCRKAEDVNLKFIAGLMYQLFRGDSDNFRKLIGFLEAQLEDPFCKMIITTLLTDTSNGVSQTEDLVISVLRATKNGEMLQKLFGNKIHECGIVRRVFLEKALFVKVFAPHERIPEKVATYLHFGNTDTDEKGPWSRQHAETIEQALVIWSDSVHLKHCPDEQQDYVDVVLLNLVKYASERIRHAICAAIIENLTVGVEIRLKSSDIRRRVRGMYIGEVLTKWFSLGELTFEYLPEASEYLVDLKKIVDGEEIAPEQKANESDDQLTKEMMELKVQDVQDTTVNDEELDSDDDDFPQYEVPEEEKNLKEEQEDKEYRRVEIPHYIRDCIEGLSEQHDYAKFEAAFNALDSMIRRRTVGYEQSAEELLRRLINLTNCFGMENFQERRVGLITSCLLTSPHLGSVAIEIMFSRSCTLETRYAILNALCEAATEYSSPKLVEVIETPETPKDEDAKVFINGEWIPRTRRFKKPPTAQLKENKFSPMANGFFYPLTAIHQHREHLDLFGRDSELLSRILACLGHLVKCSGACPCTVGMVSTLVPLLTPLRHHENFAVRQSVLFCYASICLAMSRELLMQFYSGELAEWCDYIVKLADADPSVECRQMAQVARTIVTGNVLLS